MIWLVFWLAPLRWCVVAFALVVRMVLLLIKDPKGVVKKALFKEKN